MAALDGQIIRSGGIIAAGEGRRLRRAGWRLPKPLVPVGGTPLIGHVIENFLGGGISNLVFIFNEDSDVCADWVRSNYADLGATILRKTTASSLESFFEVKARMTPGRALISTVDAWCSRGAFADFLAKARRLPADSTVLGVTRFVDDERPLWVTADAAGTVLEIGGDSGDFVTAGLYLIPEHIRRLPSVTGLDRLRNFLTWLKRRDEVVYCVDIPIVVDVDRAEDVALATRLAVDGNTSNNAGK